MRLKKEEIEAIERTLERGDRVELIPGKETIKIIRIRRQSLTVETNQNKRPHP